MGNYDCFFPRDNCLVSRGNSHRVTANLARWSCGKPLAFQPIGSVFDVVSYVVFFLQAVLHGVVSSRGFLMTPNAFLGNIFKLAYAPYILHHSSEPL